MTMNIALSQRIREFAERKLREGAYESFDQLVEAGLATLEQQERSGDFPAGELDRFLAEGEADAAAGKLYDGEEVFRELDELSAERRRGGRL
jgi:putative addiction module CopG family antidote